MLEQEEQLNPDAGDQLKTNGGEAPPTDAVKVVLEPAHIVAGFATMVTDGVSIEDC